MTRKFSTTEARFIAAWQHRGLLACVLWPLSLVFRLVVGVRRGLYLVGWRTRTRLPVPVIVVGNIYIGGTGKTPLTIWLVQALRLAGYTPGVISRGYGANPESTARLVTATSLAADVGDEPLLITRRVQCPLVVGRNRVAAGQLLLQTHPEVDVILSDDGLQHYPLQRDIEIVLCDSRGNGNGWLLPAGPLREPATRRRDFTVVNLGPTAVLPASLPPDAMRMNLLGEIAERLGDRTETRDLLSFMHFPTASEDKLAQPTALTRAAAPSVRLAPRLLAAAGIGNPQRFFTMLSGLGLVFESLALPDHYDFSANPFAALDAEIILITEKDAVKCSQIETLKNDPRVWVVPVTAQIDGALAHQIVEKLRGHPTA
ncbi:tetraacyldisaccharide 4'-kinase [Glaciimonas sp. PCH181]|uniref:tetraacyldisaccharide 4'-kinase n=1 Tax=Glaciimonas sp. PCH181 TaxID=2133943 RepID=UPI000D37991F|nr:tetraacyldisaccharide 4'-kinase [Glaciimonas sp. PCH181]PUA16892.1 tetraacyldisaccharide 4'-kinase [Glaciimonas sp. PCH181]